MKPTIGLTMGDPSGIGPEIVLKSLHYFLGRQSPPIVIFGDLNHLSSVQKKMKKRHKVPLSSFPSCSPASFLKNGPFGRRFQVVDFKNVKAKKNKIGKPSALAGRAAGDYIALSIKAAQKKMITGVVTAPINKDSFFRGGWGRRYVGHTEMFGQLTKSKNYASMLVYKKLRSLPVTYHIPLKTVSQKLNKTLISKKISLLNSGLKQMGLRRPRIAVCGLNPHAGDNGVLGKEDRSIIAPVVRQFQRRGIRVQGPFSPDIVWPKIISGHFDAGLAMYHDQAQIPIKLLSAQFSKASSNMRGVLVTLGLPFVRVSPLHGTAYDIAGKGLASAQSLIEAILLAQKMTSKRQSQ